MSGIPVLETVTGTSSPVTKSVAKKFLVEREGDEYVVRPVDVTVREEQVMLSHWSETHRYYVEGRQVDSWYLFDTEEEAVRAAFTRAKQAVQMLAMEVEKASLRHRSAVLNLVELGDRMSRV